jgi:protoheme IX farnesyltransferase
VTTAPTRTFAGRVKAYVALTKPRIIELLLITTVPAMILAAGEWPGWALVVGTVGGGALSAGGANAINNVVDRDIDAQMRRTQRRPLPAETATPREALVLGLVLGVAGYLVLWQTSNTAAAVLATSALGFYVLVYTLYLKRTTPQNIVIGGAAGAVPALVGWAAVTGEVGLAAWLLFAVIFYWTPPHFWALALRFRKDYEAAGVPMLPVVIGEKATTVQILIYSFVVAGVSLLLQPAAGLGMVYLVAALVLGVAFVGSAFVVMRRVASAITVFRFSNIYLALLFAAVALDVLIGTPMDPSLALAWVSGALVVGGSLAIVGVTRPTTMREFAFVLVPAIGAIVLSVAVIGSV